MEREDFPRFAWGSLVDIEVDVEHERGVGSVNATFQHVLWDNVSIRLVGSPKPASSRGLLGLGPPRRPRRARIVLRELEKYAGELTRKDNRSGWYRLKALWVRNDDGIWREIDTPPRLGFVFVEEKPGLPEHETNVRRYKQGEGISLEVEASHPDGVRSVHIVCRNGYGSLYPQRLKLEAQGAGNETCRVLLNARIDDSQQPGRYRAGNMVVRGRGRFHEISVPLNPPIVFEVLKNKELPRKQQEEPKPEGPNWGFSD